nr:hypothetical protein [Tanacetum cinerariifolium]
MDLAARLVREVWNYLKVFAGLPRVSSSLDSIVDYIIPISKKRFSREEEEHDDVCASLEAPRFDYPYCSLMGFFLSCCLKDCISLDLVVYGLHLEFHLRAVLFIPSLGFFQLGFFYEGFLRRRNHLTSYSPDAAVVR